MKRTTIEWQGRNIHHLDLTEEDVIAELRKENEALRGQVDACRRLDAEAWALVTAVSRPLAPEELANYPLMWGSESDFIEIIKDRMANAPKIGKNCPYCGSTFPVQLSRDIDALAIEAAHDWFTIAPKHRTKERLARHLSDLVNLVQIEIEHNGGIEDNGSLDDALTVEIVHKPRSEWPKSVTDAFDKANAEGHSVQFCRDATMLGEGCPIDQCRCTCHDPEGD